MGLLDQKIYLAFSRKDETAPVYIDLLGGSTSGGHFGPGLWAAGERLQLPETAPQPGVRHRREDQAEQLRGPVRKHRGGYNQ